MIRMVEVSGKSMKSYDTAAENAVHSLLSSGEKVHYYRETMRKKTTKNTHTEYEVVLNVAISI